MTGRGVQVVDALGRLAAAGRRSTGTSRGGRPARATDGLGRSAEAVDSGSHVGTATAGELHLGGTADPADDADVKRPAKAAPFTLAPSDLDALPACGAQRGV
jgi:hypothetical protein